MAIRSGSKFQCNYLFNHYLHVYIGYVCTKLSQFYCYLKLLSKVPIFLSFRRKIW